MNAETGRPRTIGLKPGYHAKTQKAKYQLRYILDVLNDRIVQNPTNHELAELATAYAAAERARQILYGVGTRASKMRATKLAKTPTASDL